METVSTKFGVRVTFEKGEAIRSWRGGGLWSQVYLLCFNKTGSQYMGVCVYTFYLLKYM